MTRILFLEDEPTIREVLTEYMKMQNYEVTEAADGEEAIAALKTGSFDMAAIMLTALGDEQTQVKAFNAYADDYIVKPVSPIILLKRIETILRRVKPESRQTKKGLHIEEKEYQAYYDGDSLELTLSEFLLLQTLYKNPKMVFTREQLILHIFNEDYIGNDRIIDAHVKNLRKKLPQNYIKTVIGVGYQFKQEV